MSNQDVRQTATMAGVKLWQIADALGIADSTLSRKLRRELSDAEKKRIYGIISNLANNSACKGEEVVG